MGARGVEVSGLLSFARAFRSVDSDVRLYIGVVALLGLSVFGGISVVLQNLYVIRLGYGPEAVGAVNAASQAALAAFSLPAASLGRRFGSRRMMLAAIALLVLGSGGLTLAEGFAEPLRFSWLLLAAAVASVGLCLLLVNDKAFIMGVTTPGERNHVYSMMGAVWPLACFIGGLAAGLLPSAFALLVGEGLDRPAPYRYALLVSAGIAVVAFVVMGRTRGPSAEVAGPRVPASGRAPVVLVLAMSLVVFGQVAGESSVRTFFNVYLDQSLRVSTAVIGTVAALGALVAIFAALAMPSLAGRLGRPRTFVLASVAIALALLPLALVPDLRAAGLGYAGVVAFGSLGRACNTVYQLELVRQEWRGLMAGATMLASGLSAALVALLGGRLIASTGYSALFLAAALASLAGIAWFWAYFRTPRGEYAKPSRSASEATGRGDPAPTESAT